MKTNNGSKIIFYGAPWCGDCVRAKAFLDSKNVKYEYIDIEQDEAAVEKVIELNNGNRSIPTILFPDGTVLTEPSNEQLLRQLKK
ncbi:MAG: NrdH-redoxin [Candidatus Pacebacteria bacterium CG10_big_fil_rev_8_21_14_0_10_42_12]|nr:NrdH-redoxin [Candidatus Parcubacteria bacterium]PIR63023.1 MAG: NrdH-redoxin [Candidatus Pacebacteria bacterium CG10_big_fil_rev_8_21_14_0_10_42_12]